MKPPATSDCSLAPKLLFVDWLKILANEKQSVQFGSPLVLVCVQKRCSHMPGAIKINTIKIIPLMMWSNRSRKIAIF